MKKTTLSFLIAPVAASTFSGPKILTRASIMAWSAAGAADEATAMPAAPSALTSARWI